MSYEVIHGDCLDALRALPDNSVDAVVTDPPYGLSFMGKKWDYDVPATEVWAECLRVLKPGGHLLAFAGTRTQHRMCVRIEDAGFEIRDMIAWVYSQGFPKSHRVSCDCNGKPSSECNVRVVRNTDVSASVDTCEGRGEVLHTSLSKQGASVLGSERAAPTSEGTSEPGVEGWGHISASAGKLQAGSLRPVPGTHDGDGKVGRVCDGTPPCRGNGIGASAVEDGMRASHQPRSAGQPNRQSRTVRVQSGPQTLRGTQDPASSVERCEHCGRLNGWSGWGTALKPAMEMVTMARKPLSGTVAENVQEWGTGAINVDGCRVGTSGGTCRDGKADTPNDSGWENMRGHGVATLNAGRWPANLIHDGSEEVEAAFPQSKDGVAGKRSGVAHVTLHGLKATDQTWGGYGSSGSAARFFYCAKASKADRDDGLERFEVRRTGGMQATADGSMLTGSGNERTTARANHHPTVKPTALMQYLCRLVTPPGGTVLDPFTGSGSTGRGAILEGFNFIGIEREAEYVEIARARIAEAERRHSESLVSA